MINMFHPSFAQTTTFPISKLQLCLQSLYVLDVQPFEHNYVMYGKCLFDFLSVERFISSVSVSSMHSLVRFNIQLIT